MDEQDRLRSALVGASSKDGGDFKKSTQELVIDELYNTKEDMDKEELIGRFIDDFIKADKLLPYPYIHHKTAALEDADIESILVRLRDLKKCCEGQDNKDIRHKLIKIFDKLDNHVGLITEQRASIKEMMRKEGHKSSASMSKLSSEIEELGRRVKKEELDISGIKEKFYDKLTAQTTQLVTLLGMFTALSFLLFGGASFLQDLLKNFSDTGIIKLLFIGAVWSFGFFNTMFIFLKFILVITNRKYSELKGIVCVINTITIVVGCASACMMVQSS